MKAKKSHQLAGRRKRAIARASIRAGTGMIRVNRVRLENYGTQMCRQRISEPLLIAGDLAKSVNIDVDVVGGGNTNQTDSIRLAIARALVDYAGKEKLKSAFVDYDRTLMVADVRVKEKAKPNCHGQARAKRQKSYR